MLIRFLVSILKANLGIATLLSAAYIGAQYSHVVDRVEHNLLRKHLNYSSISHRGSLAVKNVENNQGELEKRLVNLETNQFIYTIHKDYLPNSEFIFEGLKERVSSSRGNELIKFYAQINQLEELAESKLPKNLAPDNPVYQKGGNKVVSNTERSGNRIWPYVALALVGSAGLGYRKLRKFTN